MSDLRFDVYPLDGSFEEFKAPDVTAWKLARAAIEHENTLVNHRLTWLMQSQAFLLSAFSITMVAWVSDSLAEPLRSRVALLLAVIALFGIYICAIIQRSVQKAFDALKNITLHYNRLVQSHGFTRTPPLHVLRKPMILCDQHDLPFAIAILWVVLAGVLILTQYPDALSGISSQNVAVGLGIVAGALVGGFFGRVLGTRKKKVNDEAYDRNPDGTLAR